MQEVSDCCSEGLRSPIGKPEADLLAPILKAVAHPARLQLLSIIALNGQACACDLTAPVDLSQPTVSHHLKSLTEAEVIHREQRGQWAWFRINEKRMKDISALFAV
ncbi:MAG: metalloregulator ArsR/SmtB family transcription factor [Actinomycetales bacterium]|nr:metalloregulator ArsR/SmtB family transcription factor [Actinomycetales bacterium]